MFIIYNKKTTQLLHGSLHYNSYKTRGAARAIRTKLSKAGKIVKSHYKIMDESKFRSTIEKQETRINLMSGLPFTQPVNTPLCCDPSSETYWSM